MFHLRQCTLLLCFFGVVVAVYGRPDSGDIPPLPGPGLSYGGIPYGSMSGNVAEFFRQQAPSVARARNLAPQPSISKLDFRPIEQYL